MSNVFLMLYSHSLRYIYADVSSLTLILVCQVAASFAAGGAIMNELKQWNDLYGEGGSRKKEQLTYFL